ncbi:MAG: hypothetical protein E6Q78_02265 [Rhodoferax sp.]|nr:MAG: hypothetical protein E6Q78_02265 [Rhodoferax sp.]
MTSLVGALAGAFAGARAAQRVAERAKESDNLLAQLRATNAALTVAFTICNSFIQLKKQHIRPLRVSFTTQLAELQEFHRQRNAGEIPREQPFQFLADLRSVQLPLMPVEVLQRLVFDKLSVTGRPLALAASIADTIDSVQGLMQKRTELVNQFRAIPPGGQGLTVALYFGLPYGDGRVSTEYKDTLEGLFSQIDNGIFFSELLCKDLKAFGDETLVRYKKIAKKTTEHVSEIDFQLARDEGLLPDESQFSDWLRGFAKAGSPEAARTKVVPQP